MKKLPLIILLSLTLLGAFLRLYKINQIPPVLNRDEASLGYNAYSILKTGRDEHQQFLPLNIESFGDWKLGGYVYSAIPFVAIFGLHDLTIRLPAIIAGILLIPLSALLVGMLVRKEFIDRMMIWTALFAAVSPWLIRLSRKAYEAMLGLFFVELGFALLLYFLNHKRPSNYLLPLSALFFGLSIWTYHAYQLFVPLLLIGTALVYRHKITKVWRDTYRGYVAAIIIGLIFLGGLLLSGTQHANAVKFQGLTIFDKAGYIDKLAADRAYFNNFSGLPAKFYSNSFLLTASNLLKNTGQILSGSFLFTNGGGHGNHDVPGMGNVLPVVFFLALLGILRLMAAGKQAILPLLVWSIFSLGAGVITNEPAHSVRLLPLAVGICWLAAAGMSYLKRRSVIVAVMALVFYQTYLAAMTYFVVSPQRDAINYDWITKAASGDLYQLQQSRTVFIPYPKRTYYVSWLFDWKTDPQLLPVYLEYYSIDNEGFRYAKRMGNIYFQSFDWQEFIDSSDKQAALVMKKDVPKDRLAGNDLVILKTYTYPGSLDEYLLISTD